MVDGIVVQERNQIALIVHLEYKMSLLAQQGGNPAHDRVNIVHMRKDIVSRDQLRLAVLRRNLTGEPLGEVRRDQWPTLFLAGVESNFGRLDAESFSDR